MLHICFNANPCGNAFLWDLHNISKWSEVCIKQTNPITLRPQVDCFSRYNQARMQDACWSWNPFRLPFSSLDCLRVCLPWIYPWQFINIGPKFVVNILTWKLNCHLSLSYCYMCIISWSWRYCILYLICKSVSMKILLNSVWNIYYYIKLPILRQMIILDCMLNLCKNMSKI